MNIVVLMAGSSGPFREPAYPYPKNLLEINGRPLLEHVLARLSGLLDSGAQLVCLVREDEDKRFFIADTIRLLHPGAKVLRVPALESGAACSALLAVDSIDPNDSLLIYNGDHVIDADLVGPIKDFEQRSLDGGVLVFDAVHPRWSYVKTDAAGLVVEAAEKRPISRKATAGAYWFRHGADFIAATQRMILKDAQVEGRFFVCPSFNEMILMRRQIGVSEISRDSYHSLATPQGVQAYEESLGAMGSGTS